MTRTPGPLVSRPRVSGTPCSVRSPGGSTCFLSCFGPLGVSTTLLGLGVYKSSEDNGLSTFHLMVDVLYFTEEGL